jgi:hypothetical protein
MRSRVYFVLNKFLGGIKMKYLVIEKKDTGWIQHLECANEIDAKLLVEGFYKEAKLRNENREFKYIELPGTVELPKERNPREVVEEKMKEKISKLPRLFRIGE